jgi:hypothetical protein
MPESSREIHIDLQWFGKNACRLPEAIWYSMVPKTSTKADWKMDKLGREISPLEVVSLGNRHLHAVNKGISCKDDALGLEIKTMDAQLVAPGKPSLLNFSNELPDLAGGMHFNLYNNIWGTNFPMWYDEDARFRFVVRVND